MNQALENTYTDRVRALYWQDEQLVLLDQRHLPDRQAFITCHRASEVADAIRSMVIRGAPAIGIAGAYGVVLAAREYLTGQPTPSDDALSAFATQLDELIAARPTAVNLAWAVRRLRSVAEAAPRDPLAAVEAEASRIHQADIAANRRMGQLGAALMDSSTRVLTHCNTGSLATGGFGTALGVIRAGWSEGRIARVYADETRPWLQGSRLTAWELSQDGIPATVLCDGAAAALMAQGAVDWVITGADRITANGDTANKIGTYGLAVAARYHGVRFMVVAPSSTIDMNTAGGSGIPIEERIGDEVLSCAGHRVAPPESRAWNPVFDVTPASLIDVIVTERGTVERPDRNRMAELMGDDRPAQVAEDRAPTS
jgi:methylthioribose-1-phosphate isomerase